MIELMECSSSSVRFFPLTNTPSSKWVAFHEMVLLDMLEFPGKYGKNTDSIGF
jgi:hypothetical protein